MLDDSAENLEYSYLKFSNGVVNFGLMAAAWSKICSSSNYIYYKTPEHLCYYNNILESRRKYRNTVVHNIEASRSIRLVVQSKRRYKISTPAKKFRCLQPSNTTIVNPINAGVFMEDAILASVNIAPRISNFATLVEITSTFHADRRDNDHTDVSNNSTIDVNLNLNN